LPASTTTKPDATTLEGIWRAFPTQTPDLARDTARLFTRPGGVNEAQLNSKLTHEALTYIAHHPSYFLVVNALNALRTFGLGKGHTYTTNRSFAEMNVPRSLRALTTLGLQLVALIALLGLIGKLTRRWQLRPLGPVVLWAVPVLAFLATMERPRSRGHLIAWVCPARREGCGVHAQDTSAV
jgi:hypothetical protein